MTPEEDLHKAIWQILGEIRQEQLATPDDEWIIIDTKMDVRERAVRVLATTGSVKALDYQSSTIAATIQTLQQFKGVYSKPTAYKVEPLLPKFDQVYEIYSKTFEHDYNQDEIKNLTEKVRELTQSAKPKVDENQNTLSIADKKKLFILERLREEWDITPKSNNNPNYSYYSRETKLAHNKYWSWMKQCGINDWYEMENILKILQQDGLIFRFEIHSEYE